MVLRLTITWLKPGANEIPPRLAHYLNPDKSLATGSALWLVYNVLRVPLKYSLLLVFILSIAAKSAAQPHGGLIGGDPIVPTTAPAAAPATKPAGTKRTNGDDLSFMELSSYDMSLPDDLDYNTNRPAWADEKVNAMIPPKIKAFAGRKFSVVGFMIPVRFDAHDDVTDFILAKNQLSCCFGGAQQIDDFVVVRMKGAAIPVRMDVPLRVRGVFEVGAHRDRGVLDSIYRMVAETVKDAEN